MPKGHPTGGTPSRRVRLLAMTIGDADRAKINEILKQPGLPGERMEPAARRPRRIPVASVGFASDEAREAAINCYYLTELDRQAELAANSIHFAVMRGRETEDTSDPKVWGALQNSLFAAICIARLLKPGAIRKAHRGKTRNDSQAAADKRGAELRRILDVEDDCHILDVYAVRNAYEHYDEHFGHHLANGAECFADWYITDGAVLRTPPNEEAPRAVGIRIFYPDGGVLLFEDKELHLFELEVELIELRVKIADALKELRPKLDSRAWFGGHTPDALMSKRQADQRFMSWQIYRAKALEALANRKKPGSATADAR